MIYVVTLQTFREAGAREKKISYCVCAVIPTEYWNMIWIIFIGKEIVQFFLLPSSETRRGKAWDENI